VTRREREEEGTNPDERPWEPRRHRGTFRIGLTAGGYGGEEDVSTRFEPATSMILRAGSRIGRRDSEPDRDRERPAGT